LEKVFVKNLLSWYVNGKHNLLSWEMKSSKDLPGRFWECGRWSTQTQCSREGPSSEIWPSAHLYSVVCL